MVSLIVQVIKWVFLWGILLGIVAWIGYMFAWVLLKKVLTPKNVLWIKYTLLRKKPDERDIKWCVNAVENNMNEFKIRKFLLLKNVKEEKIEEIVFLFYKIKKQLQGGVK